jgi:hypothetical protein
MRTARRMGGTCVTTMPGTAGSGLGLVGEAAPRRLKLQFPASRRGSAGADGAPRRHGRGRTTASRGEAAEAARARTARPARPPAHRGAQGKLPRKASAPAASVLQRYSISGEKRSTT